MAEPTDTPKGLSRWMDEFDRTAIDTTNVWTTNSDTGGTAFAINSQTNGVVRGGVDTTDNDITNLFGNKVFRLDESSATVEIRAKAVTSVADGETYIGLTDAIATDENPITLSAADVQTNNATDAVGFAYTGGGTADWKRVAVNNGSTPTGSPTRCNVRGATTPVVGTWQTFKVALSNEGHARFWINGVEQGTIDSALRATVLLNVGIALQSGGTARSLDVDYVEIIHARRMTA